MRKILETLKRKWAEYILEITVIIIGILGAYSLNQWKTSLNEERLLDHYISSLIQDLEEQSTIIDKQLEYENNVISKTDYLRDAISVFSVENQLDTIHFLLGNLRGIRPFHMVRVTYNDLISSGNLSLMNNQDRRKAINYYESLNRVDQVINGNNTIVVTPLNMEITTYPYYSSNPNNKAILGQRLSDFVSKVKLENIIDTRNTVSQIHVRHLKIMNDETRNLITNLEND